jgi:glycosyltransferase domain-containing protein
MQGITLVIPTHNRHHYLDRSLDYYSLTSIKILVADSTDLPYVPKKEYKNVTYFHLPGLPLTKKIPHVLSLVETPFVVMCADDDFTIPEAISECIQFLIRHNEYTSVLGNCVCYLKSSAASGNVQFAAMYTDRLEYKFSADDHFKRLDDFFKVYRTIFYAVHRTQVISETFNGAGEVITNLFLNEYNSAIMPVIKGKVAGLQVLMQVREFAENSDDKITRNLDAVFTDEEFKAAYKAFLNFEAVRVAASTGKEVSACRDVLDRIFMDHARYLQALKKQTKPTLVKQIGSVVERIPVVGKKLIRLYRDIERKKNLQLFVRNKADQLHLLKIRNFINQYKNAVRT